MTTNNKDTKFVNIMMFSIIVKAISAIIEIIIHLIITNTAGISQYGEYTYFVSLIESAYFVLFSGIIKVNMFYLSNPSNNIHGFKKKFILYYSFPISVLAIISFLVAQNIYGVLSGVILFLYFLSFDMGSVYFARGVQIHAFVGEYFVGRIIMLFTLFILRENGHINGFNLLLVYGFQYLAIIIFFCVFRQKIFFGPKEKKVSIKKAVEYQKNDIGASLVSYSPSIIQFVLGDAFSTGFLGIVFIVRRILNFLSGPMGKVFLPEFSRLYENDEIEILKEEYNMIVTIQLLYVSIMSVMLVAFPEKILSLFSGNLDEYTSLFIFASVCLLLITCIGPMTGFLQMTGQEAVCNKYQIISIIMMIITCFVFHNAKVFAVYGICVQAVSEGILKYLYARKRFGKGMIPIVEICAIIGSIWIIRIIVNQSNSQYSFRAMFISIVTIIALNAFFMVKNQMIRKYISSLIIGLKK